MLASVAQTARQPGALKMYKEMEITGPHTANWNCDWLRRYG